MCCTVAERRDSVTKQGDRESTHTHTGKHTDPDRYTWWRRAGSRQSDHLEDKQNTENSQAAHLPSTGQALASIPRTPLQVKLD